MGIRGLKTFIENKCPCALEDVNIVSCAAAYQEVAGCVPFLLIDGFSYGWNIFSSVQGEGVYLGRYLEIEEEIRKLVNSLRNNNIAFKFFFDGSLLNVRDGWVDLMNEKFANKVYVADLFLEGRDQEAQQHMIKSMNKADFVKYTLRLVNCDVIVSVKEVNQEIMELLANKECFGILTGDTHYIIAEGVSNCFTVQDLDVKKLTTKVYRRKEIASAVGIDEAHLPLFATLCGSDFVTSDDLRNFHLFLLRRNQNIHRLRRVHNLPKSLIMPSVGEWIRRNFSCVEKDASISMEVAQLIRAPFLEEKIFQSMSSYLIPKVTSSTREPGDNPVEEGWSEIFSLAEKRHRSGASDKLILHILTRLTSYQGSGVELYNDPSFPSSVILTKRLRRKLYGILLKERPNSLGSCIVEEFLLLGPEFLKAPLHVIPDIPTEHPGLLYLWSDNSVDEGLKLLCWAVSGTLQPGSLLQVRQDLRLASLALFYLIHEGKSGILRWQVEALLVHAVLLSAKLEDLKELQCGAPCIMQVHFGSVDCSVWLLLLTVNDACGNPLQVGKLKQVFFDGRLFGYIYSSVANGVKGSDLCDGVVFNNILSFLYE